MDGKIIIGTEIDNSGFDKGLEKIKSKKTDDIIQKVSIDTKGIDKGIQEIEKKMNKLKNKATIEMNDISPLMSLEDTNLTEQETQYLERLETTYDRLQNKRNELLLAEQQALKTMQKQGLVQEEMVANGDKWIGNVYELSNGMKYVKKNTEELKNETEKVNFLNIKKFIEDAGKSTENIIKKIGRWTLAIFGIRSAYMLIRQSMSTLSQYNEQLATDVEYIRFAIASALQPIIERIIQLVYKLLSLIGAISKALIGKNIFENSGIDKFSKRMASSAKSAKEMNKQLAKFDEMNVLQDSSSGGTGAGGVTNITPSMDLSKIDAETEKYVEKMKNVADTVTSFWEEEWKSYFSNATGNWDKFFQGLLLSLEGFYLVFKGIFELIGGLVDIFVGIFTGDVDKMKQGWDKMVKGLFDIFKGILDLIIGIFLSFKGLIKGILLSLVDLIVNFANAFVKLINEGVNKVINLFLLLPKTVTNIIKTISGLFGNFGSKVGDIIGKTFTTAINLVLSHIETILNTPIRAINKLTDIINKMPGVNIGKLETFKLPRLARGGIVNNPGPGVMMGSYIAGEAGAEAVLPLTDDTLQRLANMIPITVNVTNTMNGRVISRELQKVQNESNFAFNR